MLYSDDWFLAFDKPSGLLSVPGRGPANADNLTTRVQQIWPEALNVHRLDMSTSGVIILARSPKAQSAIQKLFADRKVYKRYIAVACGYLKEEQGSVDLPLMKDWPNRPKQKIDFEQGLPSLTYWRVLQRYQVYEKFGPEPQNQQYSLPFESTRVELTPHTGRSHQLRVHLMSIGNPIVGDDLYANPEQIAAAHRLLLHAEILRFIHPGTKQEVEIRAETPF